MTRIFVVATTLFALAACGGGGIVAEAQAHHDAACACAKSDCVREHIKWFNKTSATTDGKAALAALTAEEQANYKKLSLAAGTCQMKLKSAEK